MARTPDRTQLKPLIVTPGDAVRGEDETAGGAVLVRGGNSTGGNNVGGLLSLTGGSGFGTGAGGDISLSAGVPAGAGAGGNVAVSATSSAALSGAGGSVTVTAGDSTGVANAGDITLIPGVPGGTGAAGVVVVGNSSAVELGETAAVPGPTIMPGEGRVWLRSDAPNVLMFTDDAGTDWVISGTGSATLQSAYDNGATIVTDAAGGAVDISGTEDFLVEVGGSFIVGVTGTGETRLRGPVGGTFAIEANDPVGVLMDGESHFTSLQPFEFFDGAAATPATDYQIVRGADPLGADDLATRRYVDSVSALGGLPGNVTENLILYVDPGDRNSYVGTGVSVTDLSLAGLATNGTLADDGSGIPPAWDDGNFRFNPGSRDNFLRFNKSGALDDLFDGGGTILVWARMDGWVGSSPSEAVLACTASGLSFVTGNATAEILDGWCLSIQEQVTGFYDPAVLFSQKFATGRNRYQTTRDVSDVDKTPRGVGSSVTGVSPYRTGRWVCVAVTYDSGALANDPTMYIDGLPRIVYANDYGGLNQSGVATLGPFDSDVGNDLYIGNVLATTVQHSFLGMIGPVLAFDRILNPGEISRVYNVFASRYGMGVHALDATTPGAASATRRFGTNLLLSGGVAAAAATGSGTRKHGGNVVIRGSRGTLNSPNDPFSDGGTNEAAAGSVFIAGGDIGADPNSTGPKLSGGEAGDVEIRGGYGGLGGNVTIEAGKRSSTAPSNQDTVSILGGESAFVANLNTAGGSVRVQGGSCGQGAFNKLAGDVTIQGGFNAGISGGAFTGGNVSILSGGRAGNSIGNARGNSGSITLSTDASNGIPATPASNEVGTGAITLTTEGVPATTSTFGGESGDIALRTGDGRIPGDVSIRAGDVVATANGDVGGGVSVRAGDAWNVPTATNAAGSVEITAGDAPNAGSVAVAGNVTLRGGNASGTGNGGDVNLNPGTSASGPAGEIVPGGAFDQDSPGMKFGTATGFASGTGTITFTTPFSAVPRMVQLTVEHAAGSVIGIEIQSVTATQINWASAPPLVAADKVHFFALL